MGNVCDDPIGRLLEEDGREILDGMPPDGCCAITYKDGCLAFVTAIDTDVPLDVLRIRADFVYTYGDGVWRLRENAY